MIALLCFHVHSLTFCISQLQLEPNLACAFLKVCPLYVLCFNERRTDFDMIEFWFSQAPLLLSVIFFSIATISCLESFLDNNHIFAYYYDCKQIIGTNSGHNMSFSYAYWMKIQYTWKKWNNYYWIMC